MKKLFAASAVLAALALTSCTSTTTSTSSTSSSSQMIMSIGVMIFFFAIMYFMMIRPQKKQEKEQKAMLDSMTIGDTVLTTSGFYGVVIDITSDTIIVEFGNNKNCRIPMQKSAVVSLEHPDGWAPAADTADTKDQK